MADDIDQSAETVAHTSFRSAVDAFIAGRLQAKLEKLKEDDPKRIELLAQHQRGPWLDDAGRRVRQIQAVTHALKPIHPDARGTNIYIAPDRMVKLDVVGSHVLGEKFTSDVVGNAAALDVYKLLRLEVNGKSLLQALKAGEADALTALSNDEAQAQSLQKAFISLIDERETTAGTHPRAKQLYWLAGNEASDDGHYHLLAPLYATSLAHVMHTQLQEHRFGDANKASRQARRDGKMHDGSFHHYPDLAVQKLGGTKPQNISQLNSERGGTNYLLSSLPPSWASSEFRIPAHTGSVFDRIFGARVEVRRTVGQMRRLLESDPAQNKATRDSVEALVERLIDELMCMAGGFQRALPAGWSLEQDCAKLHPDEQLWLDPLRAQMPAEEKFAQEWLWMDWPAAIAKRFAEWLNGQLEGKHVFGDAEQRQWKKMLLVDESTDGWAQQLRRLRKQLDGAHGMATQQTQDALAASKVTT